MSVVRFLDHISHTDSQTGFLMAIGEANDSEDAKPARMAYMDWLQENDQNELAKMLGVGLSFYSDLPDYRLAYADRLERSGIVGILPFTNAQLQISMFQGERTPEQQKVIDWEYAALLKNWRVWLPKTVTTLGRTSDMEAYNRDYYSPSITFPTRKRKRYERPLMSVLFRGGFPERVECDDEDWRRCRIDMLRLYPWVDRFPSMGF